MSTTTHIDEFHAENDTIEGLAKSMAEKLNTLGKIETCPRSLSYIIKAQSALKRIDGFMVDLILRCANHQPHMQLWASRLKECEHQFKALRDRVEISYPNSDEKRGEIIVALATIGAILEGAQKTLEKHGICVVLPIYGTHP